MREKHMEEIRKEIPMGYILVAKKRDDEIFTARVMHREELVKSLECSGYERVEKWHYKSFSGEIWIAENVGHGEIFIDRIDHPFDRFKTMIGNIFNGTYTWIEEDTGYKSRHDFIASEETAKKIAYTLFHGGNLLIDTNEEKRKLEE